MKKAIKIIKENIKTFIILNLAYFGLVLLMAIYTTLFNPQLQNDILKALGVAFGPGGELSAVGDAYTQGRVFPAIGLTFIINLVVGSFISITLPSLIIPFSGFLVAIYRAILWGILFAFPAEPWSFSEIVDGIGIVVLLFLEGEAYILAALGAFLQSKTFLFPKQHGLNTRWEGYKLGLQQTGYLYILVALVLIIAAIYEVVLAVFFIAR